MKKDICKSIILSKIGKYKKHIFARKCVVKPIDKHIFYNFCNKNHLFGSNKLGKCFYGIFYKGILYGAISGGYHHRNVDKNTLVLDRLCFKKETQIIGGANKLFKRIIQWAKNNNYNKIKTWSDNRWSKGEVYKKMNFILDKELKPDYSYVCNKKRKRISKQSQQKKKTNCPSNMTELEWATERGFARIWDCGKKRWVYKLN